MHHRIAAITFLFACAIQNKSLAAATATATATASSVGDVQHIRLVSHDDDNVRSVVAKVCFKNIFTIFIRLDIVFYFT